MTRKICISIRPAEALKETSSAHLIGSDQSLRSVFEHSIKAKSIVGLGCRERRQTIAAFFEEQITS